MPDRYSADVATRILASGGNAVDAAVASAFTLAVTYPEAGNIGGGGFMLAYVGGEATFLDYREVAPAAATRDMYLDAKGEVVEGMSLTGHRAVGVPGTVAGLWEAHRRHGKLSWSAVVQPAVEYAARGFVVPADLARVAQKERADRLASTNFASHFSGLTPGATFRQPELAATLRACSPTASTAFTVASPRISSCRRCGAAEGSSRIATSTPIGPSGANRSRPAGVAKRCFPRRRRVRAVSHCCNCSA